MPSLPPVPAPVLAANLEASANPSRDNQFLLQLQATMLRVQRTLLRQSEPGQLLPALCRDWLMFGCFASAAFWRCSADQPWRLLTSRGQTPEPALLPVPPPIDTEVRLQDAATGAELTERGAACAVISLCLSVAGGDHYCLQLTITPATGELCLTRDMLQALTDDLALALARSHGGFEHATQGQRVRYLAEYDALTGLPNQRRFEQELNQRLHAVRGTDNLTLALFDFTDVQTQTLAAGRAAYAALLLQITARFEAVLGEGDLAGRFTAGEFALALTGTAAAGARMLQTLQDSLHLPYRHEQRQFQLPFALGLAIGPRTGNGGPGTAGELLALARQKLERKDHRPQLPADAAAPAPIPSPDYARPPSAAVVLDAVQGQQEALQQALEQQQIALFYQARIEAKTGRCTGVEALLYWQPPGQHGWQAVAADAAHSAISLQLALNHYLLLAACRQLQSWREQGRPALVLAVNITTLALAGTDLLATVEQVLSQSALPAAQLELDLSETALMHAGNQLLQPLQALKALGLRLAIADFGTGYSFLSYLKHFPIDCIKIDRRYIEHLIINPDDAVIVRAILALGHSLQLCVLAQGVSSEAQFAWLARHDCDLVERCDEAGGLHGVLPAADFVRHWQSQTSQLSPAGAHDNAEARVLLVVDDEPGIVQAIRRLLRPHGIKVLTAGNGEEALQQLALHAVGVILCDQRMPGLRGTELLARAHKLYPEMVSIVLTGYSDLGSVIEAVNLGSVYRLMTKPWDDAQLCAAVNEAFRHYQRGRQQQQLDRRGT